MTLFGFSWGPTAWLLAGTGIVAAVVFVARWFALLRARVDYVDFLRGVTNVLEKGNDDEAMQICDDTPGPLADIVLAAVRSRSSGAEALRAAVDAAGRTAIGRLERRLASLAVIAQTAPLVGLFGTIAAFVRVAKTLHGAELISRAELLPEAFSALGVAGLGLAVAVMAQVMYAILRVRLDRISGELEAAASEIVAFIASRGGADRG